MKHAFTTFWRRRSAKWLIAGIAAVLVAAIVLLIVFLPAERGATNEPSENNSGVASETSSSRWRTYTNQKYSFSISHPSWRISAGELPSGEQVINMYPAGQADHALMGLHEDRNRSYIAFFPNGLATEGPIGTGTEIMTLDLQTHPYITSATAYKLSDSGDTYGYLLTLRETPEAWSQNGFIWAQAAVPDGQFHCMTVTGTEKGLVPAGCDYLGGTDIASYTGHVNQSHLNIIERMLESLQFTTS